MSLPAQLSPLAAQEDPIKAVLATVGVVALALLAGGVAVLGGAPGDVPDMGGYVIGSPGDPVIEVYPAGVPPREIPAPARE